MNTRQYMTMFGTVGAALAGYLLANEKLRHELRNAEDAEDAVKLLSKHVKNDTTRFAIDIKKYARSGALTKKWHNTQDYMKDKFGAMKRTAKREAKEVKAKATDMAHKAKDAVAANDTRKAA
ncbi:MAG: hypothetical protein KBD00_00225 [Candidatus Peribacteraceae bacterium]|nr:hypothetical protein [Candidatus Peribacteraceae bacterium]